MVKLKNEKTVKIVQKMFENVQAFAETELPKTLKNVIHVQKMFENVQDPAEMEKLNREKNVIIE
jgi:hypothetical protein